MKRVFFTTKILLISVVFLIAGCGKKKVEEKSMSLEEQMTIVSEILKSGGDPDTVVQNHVEIEHSKIVTLDFHQNDSIGKIPESLGKLSYLKTLIIMATPGIEGYVQSLPESISSLKELHKLVLRNSKTKIVPKVVFQLTSLDSLDLSGNEIDFLPDEIKYLSRLTWLNLNFNHLLELPVGLCSLKSLTELYVDNNKINDLPKCLSNLSELKTISLGNNNITTIPEILFSLKGLECIYLNNNKINYFDNRFSEFSNLNELNMRNNGIKRATVSKAIEELIAKHFPRWSIFDDSNF
jgi:Leucine-rich repeat (LRR) protein